MSNEASERRSAPIVGGSLLLAAAITWLLAGFNVGLTVGPTVLFLNLAFSVASDLLLLASMIVLALGFRGEPGVFGGSRIARTAAIVFGARNLAFQVFSEAAPPVPGSVANITAAAILNAVFVAAIVVLTISQTRRRQVTGGFVPPALWAVAVCDIGVTVLGLAGGVGVALFVVRAHLDALLPLSLLALGAAYLVPRIRSARGRATSSSARMDRTA